VLENACDKEIEEADESHERNQPAKNTQQDITTEHEAQNDPKEALAPRVEAPRNNAEQQPRRPTRPYAKWKGGGFLFPFIFLCASHNLRLFFYAVAEPVWMESVSVA